MSDIGNSPIIIHDSGSDPDATIEIYLISSDASESDSDDIIPPSPNRNSGTNDHQILGHLLGINAPHYYHLLSNIVRHQPTNASPNTLSPFSFHNNTQTSVSPPIYTAASPNTSQLSPFSFHNNTQTSQSPPFYNTTSPNSSPPAVQTSPPVWPGQRGACAAEAVAEVNLAQPYWAWCACLVRPRCPWA